MGLFRPVKLHFYKAVAVEKCVRGEQDRPSILAKGRTDRSRGPEQSFRPPIQTTVKGAIGSNTFTEDVTLHAQ